jgi:hypothetical protein
MPKKAQLPQARLMKVALEAIVKPDLQRFTLLHQVAADLQGYPDWEASSHHVRVLDRTAHRGIKLSIHEIRYIQDSGKERGPQDHLSPLPPTLFPALQVTSLQRMGHRRWYVARLDMSYQEAVDLFHLRYYPQVDPAGLLRHRIEDVLYRVDTRDDEGWRWHITFAPVPRSQTVSLLQYDFDAHWGPDQGDSAAKQFYENLPEVGLYLDLDCYRDTADMPIADWEEFVVRSGEKIDQTAKAFIAHLGDEDIG